MVAAVVRAGLLAVLATAGLAFLGLVGFAWNDYDLLAADPVAALLRGEWATFLGSAPAEGPSLLLRAPIAVAVHGAGGGELAVYRALAVPGLVAVAVLAVVAALPRLRPGPRQGWAWLVVVLIAANPLALRALDTGHAEELLAAALAVGAVLLARDNRAAWAGLLLGLCIATKLWGVVVIGPVLVVLRGSRPLALAVAGVIAAAFVAPFALAAPVGAHPGLVNGVRSTGTDMQPWQAWWFLGDADRVVRGFNGLVKADFRTLPASLAEVTRPVTILVAAALAGLWARRRRGDVLALLALVLLVRCLLDPYDNAYYHLPMLLALTTWEATARRGVPVVSFGVTLLTLVVLRWVPGWASPDLQAGAYLLFAVPLAAWLAAVAFGLRRPVVAPRPSPEAVV